MPSPREGGRDPKNYRSAPSIMKCHDAARSSFLSLHRLVTALVEDATGRRMPPSSKPGPQSELLSPAPNDSLANASCRENAAPDDRLHGREQTHCRHLLKVVLQSRQRPQAHPPQQIIHRASSLESSNGTTPALKDAGVIFRAMGISRICSTLSHLRL